MLPGARLGDDALLAHLLGEQRLAHGVVDLVRAGVVQVLALEVDVRGAVMLGEALGEVQGVRAPDVVLQDGRELGLRGRDARRKGQLVFSRRELVIRVLSVGKKRASTEIGSIHRDRVRFDARRDVATSPVVACGRGCACETRSGRVA